MSRRGEPALVTAPVPPDSQAREEHLTRLAFYDELTQLPKTRLIKQFVADLIDGRATCFALAFIDLDNFKYINDYYGHDVGDKLLQKVAERLSQSMTSTDMLARVGGDEFVLVSSAPDGTPADIVEKLGALSERFAKPFFIDGFEIFSSGSIGVSVYPLHGHGYEALRANADRAMYRAKEHAKGTVRVYDKEINDAVTARLEIEQRLRLAIRDRKIHCAFQPQVDFRSDTITGVEALLRWRDDNGNLQPPGQFISLAIELGLMDEITLMIFEQIIEQIDDVNDAFGASASISINIAAKQATDVRFMRRLTDAIVASSYARRFIIELTEEAFLSADTFRTQVLPFLTEAGLRVSIDDFGVGYSSLSALLDIGAHELKLDRAFIRDIHLRPRSQTIVKMVELLGDELNMHVIVEGVEKREELDYLLRHTKISCAQGYYFAKPMVLRAPAAAASPSVRRSSPTSNRGIQSGRSAGYRR